MAQSATGTASLPAMVQVMLQRCCRQCGSLGSGMTLSATYAGYPRRCIGLYEMQFKTLLKDNHLESRLNVIANRHIDRHVQTYLPFSTSTISSAIVS